MHYTTDELLESANQINMPVIAFVAYKNNDRDDIYIESHDIDEKGRLGVGIPLSEECFMEIASAFSTDQATMPFGKIPPGLLYADNRMGCEKYVWYNPPSQRMMYFTKCLGLNDGLYHVPGVVYAVQGQKLDIYAFKGKKPYDKLWQAPFFNVTGSSVCLGNAKAECNSCMDYESLMACWEKKFWMSEFSHPGGACSPIKGNLVFATAHWKEKFDYNLLLPSNVRLNDLLY